MHEAKPAEGDSEAESQQVLLRATIMRSDEMIAEADRLIAACRAQPMQPSNPAALRADLPLSPRT